MFQPLEERISPPKFHTKSPKHKPKKPESSVSNSLSESPFDSAKVAKAKKSSKMDKALVQLEKLTFPLQVKIVQFSFTFQAVTVNNTLQLPGPVILSEGRRIILVHFIRLLETLWNNVWPWHPEKGSKEGKEKKGKERKGYQLWVIIRAEHINRVRRFSGRFSRR